MGWLWKIKLMPRGGVRRGNTRMGGGGGRNILKVRRGEIRGDARRGSWMSKGGCHEGVSGHGCQEGDDRRQMTGGGCQEGVSGGGVSWWMSGGGVRRGYQGGGGVRRGEGGQKGYSTIHNQTYL